MSHIFQVPDEIYAEIAASAAQRGQSPDALLISLVKEAVELLKQKNSTTPSAPLHEASYDPARDLLAPFIGAFDSGGDDLGWIERHDAYFAGNGDYRERYDNKN